MPPTHALTPAQLRDLESELRYELERLERSHPPERAFAADPLSVGATMESEAFGGLAVALDGRVRTRRVELLGAIDRVENGDYGVCVRCGSAIPYGRLMIMPETAYCIRCGAAS